MSAIWGYSSKVLIAEILSVQEGSEWDRSPALTESGRAQGSLVTYLELGRPVRAYGVRNRVRQGMLALMEELLQVDVRVLADPFEVETIGLADNFDGQA